MTGVALEEVWFSYGRREVLRGLSLRTTPGGVVAFLGPNGSGKSTLLKLVLGLHTPSRGTVRLDGEDVRRIPRRALARRLAYVPQLHREAFAYTVAEVVLMGRMPHAGAVSGYGAADRRAVAEALSALGIGHLAARPYTQVSGGERQLTLIARALAQGARTLVMDEPTNGLDYGNQVRLLERVGELARQGVAFLFSSHHPDHALAAADRVILLAQGRVVGDGPPAVAITAASLSALYGVDVRMVTVQEGVEVCVPGLRLRDGPGAAAPPARGAGV
ncbi:MAG TPA: ABC transporter ATP-binding protein [Anaeromyxobacter sp.]|nr:ABC transporter ATP-binding protein [Anaeromyxobacter sp.]